MSIPKHTIVILYTSSSASKYANEILRYVVHHSQVLSPRKALECFYNQFVNYRGCLDTHMPADLAMEHVVRDQKRLIKYMFSSKTEQNITRRSSALAAIVRVSENYDMKTGTVMRARKHATVSAFTDEVEMAKDLRSVRPFTYVPGRKFTGFETIESTFIVNVSNDKLLEWLSRKVDLYTHELGK